MRIYDWVWFSKNRLLTISAPTPRSGQTHSDNFVGCCRRIAWRFMTILLGWRLRDYRRQYYFFFLTNSILMHYYYAFFTTLNVTFIEIFVLLLFSNFKFTLYQYCDLFTSHWFYYTISKVIKEFKFLIYLSNILFIYNVTWEARVGIYNSSNHCSK